MLLGPSSSTILMVIAFGIGGGLFGMLNIVTWPKLYGRKHFGAISGFAMAIVVAASAIGPWTFSLIKKINWNLQSRRSVWNHSDINLLDSCIES